MSGSPRSPPRLTPPFRALLQSKKVVRKLAARTAGRESPLDPELEKQFATGRLFALVASRPGQCGRVDGYILEGKELAFYLKKMQKKKGGASAA